MARLLLLAGLVLADELSHVYESNEAVTVWFGKVRSRSSHDSVYAFSSLPFCRGESISAEQTHGLTLDEIIEGFEMQNSGMDIRFRQERNQTHLCTMQLSPSTREKLKAVLKEPIALQIFLDDLLVWGLLGEREIVYSNVQWEIHYNSDQIIQVVYKPTHPI